jgi:Tol biopolymer transport system component
VSDTRDLLRPGVEGYEPTPDAFERVLVRRDRKQRNRRVVAGIVGIAVFVIMAAGLLHLLGSKPTPADPEPIQPRDGKIAYQDDGRITVMEPDGSGKVQLTSGDYPDWSPDGTKIAYVLGASLFIMNADGSDQTLVQGPINDRIDSYRHPSWSPDGTQLVFAAGLSDGRDRSELYVVGVDGSGLTEITSGPLQGWWPSWSPDGTKIAFRTGLPWRLATMGPDGSNLTQFPGSADHPDWSPDGSQIIFIDRGDVFRINSDGTGRTKLADSLEPAFFPVYSSDGTQIAFTRPDCGTRPGPCLSSRDAFIFTMVIGGTDVVRVAKVAHAEDSLSWQPT